MSNTLVVYYSNTGNNKFLAAEIAKRLDCEIEQIKPVLNFQLLLMWGIGLGNRRLKKDLSVYDRVILVGPVWMGSFIYPLRQFVAKHRDQVTQWLFVTCCGSSYKLRDDKYGHEMVFRKVCEMFPDLNINCKALPITMTMPEELQEDTHAMLDARLTEASFKGLFREKFNALMAEIG